MRLKKRFQYYCLEKDYKWLDEFDDIVSKHFQSYLSQEINYFEGDEADLFWVELPIISSISICGYIFEPDKIKDVWEAVEQFGYTLESWLNELGVDDYIDEIYSLDSSYSVYTIYDLIDEYYDGEIENYYREKEEDFYDLINYANELRLEAISNLNN